MVLWPFLSLRGPSPGAHGGRPQREWPADPDATSPSPGLGFRLAGFRLSAGFRLGFGFHSLGFGLDFGLDFGWIWLGFPLDFGFGLISA